MKVPLRLVVFWLQSGLAGHFTGKVWHPLVFTGVLRRLGWLVVEKKQIPGGNDRKKGKSKDQYRDPSLRSRMTTLLGWGRVAGLGAEGVAG